MLWKSCSLFFFYYYLSKSRTDHFFHKKNELRDFHFIVGAGPHHRIPLVTILSCSPHVSLELIFLEGHSEFTSSSTNFKVMEMKKKDILQWSWTLRTGLQFDLQQKVTQLSKCNLLAEVRPSSVEPCCRNELVWYAEEKLKRTDSRGEANPRILSKSNMRIK